MIIEGGFTVKAPLQKLWDTLFDVQALAACLPGTKKIEQLDPKTYDVTISQKVGIVKVTMRGRQVLTAVEEPTHLELEGEAEDLTKLGRMKDRVTIDLKDLGTGEVQISYKIDVSLVGKIAMFGDRIMRTKANEVEKDFVNLLQARLANLA